MPHLSRRSALKGAIAGLSAAATATLASAPPAAAAARSAASPIVESPSEHTRAYEAGLFAKLYAPDLG